ncbi:MAG TPA: hypothetical protein VHC96_12955 [Puia sp.]|jgi:hypothetical protein|nr:hypothetical protein [Puia sp.]
MNKILKIATVLTWINMIIWSFFCLNILFSILSSGATAFLILFVFCSAIVLHSYASLQLQKSLKNPAVPLSSQTSTGIRFIGVVALLLGLLFVIAGIIILTNATAVFKFLQDYTKDAQPKAPSNEIGFTLTMSSVRIIGLCYLLIGLSVAINVNLNFRLLRWYYFLRNNSNDREK